MNKNKLKDLLNELLDNWLRVEQDMINEVCWGEEAKQATKDLDDLRKEYEEKINEALNN